MTDSELVYFEKHYRENLDITDYTPDIGKGKMINGQAGSGKTTKLCKMVHKDENSIVLAFTNKAVDNVKNRLVKMGFNGDVNKTCFTYDSYFCEWNGRNIDSLEGKTIFIEEYSMVPNKWMTKIYEAFTLYNNKIYMFGDSNQCSPVEGNSRVSFDYMRSKTVQEMCPRTKTLEYIEDSCRYDKKTHEILEKFLKHGKLSSHFENIDEELYKNICYLNSTRVIVNTKCCDKFTEDKQYITLLYGKVVLR